MRIWDVDPKSLCRKHLLGEHRELHGLWNILTVHKESGGYSHHPETLRWKNKLKALYLRHKKLVLEMKIRNYIHRSDLNRSLATGKSVQNKFINSIKQQKQLLFNKKCLCFNNNPCIIKE